MADPTDLGTTIGNIDSVIFERSLNIKDLQSMMKNASAVLGQIQQYYQSSGSFFKEEERLFAERTKALQEEKRLLEEYGRSTYEKDLEILQKQRAENIAAQVRKTIETQTEGLQKISGELEKQKGPLKKENESIQETYRRIFGAELFDNMLKAMQDAGMSADIVKQQLKDDEEGRAGFMVAYYAALRETSLKNKEKELKAERDTEKYLKDTFKMTQSMVTNMLHISDYSNSFAMNILKVPGAATEAAKAFKEMLSPLNLGLNIMSKMLSVTKELVFSFDNMFSSYARGGGLIEQDKDMLMTAAAGVRSEGISEELIGRSGEALHSFYSDFSMLNESARVELTQTGARLEKVGVSASTYAGLLDKLTNSLGKSWEESNAILMDLEQSGRELGISSKKTFEDFNNALSTLAMYGDKAQGVFKTLQKEAKKTGLEMSTLLALEEKFLTFDNAAEFAGKMAAIAGKNVIDPIKLMMATGDEKIEMVRSALQSANIKDPRGIMYMAKGLGLNPAQVKALMDETSGKQDPKRDAAGFQDVVQMSITLAEKFKNALKSLAVAVSPLLKLLTWLVSGLQWLAGVWDGLLIQILIGGALLILTLAKIYKAFMALKAVGGILGFIKGLFAPAVAAAETAAITAKTAAIQAQTAAYVELAAAQKAAGVVAVTTGPAFAGFAAFMTALSAGAVGMLAFGAMLLLIAAGIWVLAQALRGFAAAAGQANLEQWASLALGLTLLSGAFVVFGFAMAFAAPLMLFAGPAIMVLLGLLAALTVTIPTVAPLLGAFAKGLTSLSIAFVGFVFRMIKAGAAIMFSFGAFGKGFSAFKSAIKSLASAMKDLSVETINAFNNMLVSLLSLTSKASAFSVIAAGIREVVDALTSLNMMMATGLGGELKALHQFSTTTGSGITEVIKSVGTLDDAKIKQYEELVKVTEKLVEVSKNSEADKIATLINSTKEVIKSGATGAGAMPKEIVVKCILNDREIGNAVVPLVREEVFGTSLLTKR